MNPPLQPSSLRHLVPATLLAGLLWLSYRILEGFFQTIAWAVIIAYVAWPSYLRLKARLNQNTNLSSLIYTSVISIALALVLYWITAMLQRELRLIYPAIVANLTQPGLQLPDSLRAIPWLNDLLQDYLGKINSNDISIKAQILDWVRQSLGKLGNFIGSVGKHLFKLGFCFVTLFFCFRDGEKIVSEIKQGTLYFLGDYQKIYLQTAGDTTRAVVYGLILAAMSQGLIAALGFKLASVNAPVLLGAITALLAIVPFGATLAWLPVSIGLVLSGQMWNGVFLFLWGVLLISTVDNVIRPLVISGASRIPFPVVMFGVFGGLTAFGGVGLFLGPIILSVALSVWRAWLNQQAS